MNLRPHDVVVLAKLVTIGAEPVSQADVAANLGMSAAEISNVLTRAAYAHLFAPSDRKEKRRGHLGSVRINGLCEFVVHGIRYAFPARLGEIAIGLPTAWGAPPMAATILPGNDGIPVWPDSENDAQRGMALQPLYASAPYAARRDRNLYEILALIDTIRVGGARERGMAVDLFRKKMGHK